MFRCVFNLVRGKIVVMPWLERTFDHLLEAPRGQLANKLSAQDEANLRNDVLDTDYRNYVYHGWFTTTYVDIVRTFSNMYLIGFLVSEQSVWQYFSRTDIIKTATQLASSLTKNEVYTVAATSTATLLSLAGTRFEEERFKEEFQQHTITDNVITACIALRMLEATLMNVDQFRALGINVDLLIAADIRIENYPSKVFQISLAPFTPST